MLRVVNLNFTVGKLTERGVDVRGSIPRQERGFLLPPRPDPDSVSLGFGASYRRSVRFHIRSRYMRRPLPVPFV